MRRRSRTCTPLPMSKCRATGARALRIPERRAIGRLRARAGTRRAAREAGVSSRWRTAGHAALALTQKKGSRTIALMRPRALVLHAVFVGGIALSPASVAGEALVGGEAPVIYKWIDTDGVAHYTADPERVPANVRSLIREPGSRADAARRPLEAAPAHGASERWAAENAPPPVSEAPPVAEERIGAAGFETTAAPEQVARAPAPELAAERSVLDAEIAALEERIGRDEEALVELLSEPPGAA